ncbi:MAG TPA: hypothetical protein VLK58_15560 [Conexibacter sp.]|nr:hypothetical protein [Conexibacter sp.]
MLSASNQSDGYRLAFDEARRALEDQERAVAELRTRAGALIAAAAITTSFFGSQMTTVEGFGAPAWLAIASFVALGFTVLAILWPRHDWEFSMSASDVISTYLEPAEAPPMALHMIHRDLALHMDRSGRQNRQQLRRLMIVFRVGAVLLIIEVVAWVVALIAQS